MAIPALRIPLSLSMDSFEKSIDQAKSLTSGASEFLVKEFAKMQLKSNIKMVVNSEGFKPAVQNATKLIGDAFDAQKGRIQDFTQTTARETAETGLKVASVFASPAIKGSFQAFTAVGVPAITGVASALAPLALRALAVYTAFELVSGAVHAAIKEIEALVAIADKSRDLTVSPQFLQLFEAEARKTRVSVDDLDGALKHAFDATKEKAPIDLAKWEVAGERITDTELALRVYNAELQKTGQSLGGLVLFRDAKTQDDKVRAILLSMKELDSLGQHLQSLELGEKFFGTTFVDRIRQGRTSAAEILTTMEKVKATQDGVFDDALVKRAKEVDEQLKVSQQRLDRALKPSWDALAEVVLSIKSYWTDVVNLMAQVVEATNKIGSATKLIDLSLKKGQLEDVNKALATGTGIGGIPRIPGADTVRGLLGQPSIDDDLKQRREKLRGEIDSIEREIRNTPEGPANETPSRGAGAKPTLKKTGEENRDPFDVAVDNTNKRIATLKAEAATIDDTTAARDRAKTVALLEEAAKRANTAAGLKNTEVTKDQRETIEKEADALAKVSEAFQKAQVNSQVKFAAGTAFLSQSDVAIAQQLKGLYKDIPTALNSGEAAALRFAEATREVSNTISSNLTTALADVVDGTKTAGQAFQAFGKVVIRAIEEAIVKLLIVGPLMRGLQSGLGGLGLGSLLGAGGANSGRILVGNEAVLGGFASGTQSSPSGWHWVGENGPELMNMQPGAQVIPSDVSKQITGGTTAAVNVSIDARGADPATAVRLAHQIDDLKRNLPGIIVGTVEKARTRRSL